MRRILNIVFVLFIVLNLSACKEKALPIPEITSGIRGELGIDKNINEETIDKYLNRKDSVYRDLRMLVDEAEYENIGGDSYLSGIVKGFEVVPFPYICNVEGLPLEVGNTYSGVTLFTKEDGQYLPNYKESFSIIEELFPKDKNIFLMCGGGGYAGMMKELLVAFGWDENKIYNVGGYWYYEGNNKIETKSSDNGEIKYDFSLINYHDIDFNKLTKIRDFETNSNNKELEIPFPLIASSDDLTTLIDTGKTFAVFVYLPNCSSCAKFLPIVEDFLQENDIEMFAVSLRDIWYDENPIKERISYTPSIFIFENKKVLGYLDAEKNEDKKYYQTAENLSNWFSQYINVKMVITESESGIDDCENACKLGD